MSEAVEFLKAIYGPSDWVLFRPIEIWDGPRGRQTRVDHQGIRYEQLGLKDQSGGFQFLDSRLETFAARLLERSKAENTNVFFGVCPRIGSGGEYDKSWQVRTVRVLWVDIDHVTAEDARKRVADAGLPPPTITVSSGSGVHFYWLLDEPYRIDDAGSPLPVKTEWTERDGKRLRREYIEDPATGERLYLSAKQNQPQLSPRAQFAQDIVSGIAGIVGGDSTQDLARLLRLPGSENRKNARNGQLPKPCRLAECDPSRRYSIDVFSKLAETSPARVEREAIKQIPLPQRKSNSASRRQKLDSLLAACAAADRGARSEADFALACYAVEIGLSADETYERCGGVGKFAERGRVYFDLTWTAGENHTRELRYFKARQRAAKRAEQTSEAEADNEAPERRKLNAGKTDLKELAGEVWEAVQAANSPPFIFRRAAAPVRIEYGDEGEPIIKDLDYNRAKYELTRVADWYREKPDGEDGVIETPSSPTKEIALDFLATPNMPLPVLIRIVEAPCFSRDGKIQTTPGYHPNSRTFYAPAAGFVVPDVSPRPTKAEIAEARRLFQAELLGDFPFISDPERTHAIAFALLPFARDLISSPTPLHLFEKPSPGTGSTLLVDCLAHAATGRPIPAMTEASTEAEWTKKLTAKFRGGTQFVLIDNLKRRLESPALASAITSPTWEDRVLSTSEMVRVPIKAIFLATGNNPAVSSEISRRCIRSRLDAKVERPWLRTGFRHEDLRAWTSENRGRLVWAALTLIQAWIAEGKPRGTTKLGMFEHWSEIFGGIFEVAEIPGFLGNLSEFYDESDSEGTAWRAFLTAWWGKFGGRLVKVSELWEALKNEISLPVKDGSEQGQRVQLGQKIAEMRDRVFDIEAEEEVLRIRLDRGEKHKGAFQWRLFNLSTGVENGESQGDSPETHRQTHRGLTLYAASTSVLPGESGESICNSSAMANQKFDEEENFSPHRGGLKKTHQTLQTHRADATPPGSGNGNGNGKPPATRTPTATPITSATPCPSCTAGRRTREKTSHGTREICADPSCRKFYGYVNTKQADASESEELYATT